MSLRPGPNEMVRRPLGLTDDAGTPYIVARIIEFLPPHSTPKKGSKGPTAELSVRLSLYYRPSDVSSTEGHKLRVRSPAVMFPTSDSCWQRSIPTYNPYPTSAAGVMSDTRTGSMI